MHNPAIDPAYAEEILCNFPSIEGFRDTCELFEISERRCHFAVSVPASLANYRGTIHGGAIYLVSEVACGIATYALGRQNVCMQANINFVKSVPCGTLDVTTEMQHRGRSSALVHVTIADAATGKTISESSHTMFLMGPLHSES